jgi:hypothetical protein
LPSGSKGGDATIALEGGSMGRFEEAKAKLKRTAGWTTPSCGGKAPPRPTRDAEREPTGAREKANADDAETAVRRQRRSAPNEK